MRNIGIAVKSGRLGLCATSSWWVRAETHLGRSPAAGRRTICSLASGWPSAWSRLTWERRFCGQGKS
jgi:hypothetical protein